MTTAASNTRMVSDASGDRGVPAAGIFTYAAMGLVLLVFFPDDFLLIGTLCASHLAYAMVRGWWGLKPVDVLVLSPLVAGTVVFAECYFDPVRPGNPWSLLSALLAVPVSAIVGVAWLGLRVGLLDRLERRQCG